MYNKCIQNLTPHYVTRQWACHNIKGYAPRRFGDVKSVGLDLDSNVAFKLNKKIIFVVT